MNVAAGRRPYDGNATTSGTPNQVLVRIDWILFAGAGVTVSNAAVVGEKPLNAEHAGKSELVPEVQYAGPWPSDHRAVLGVFQLSPEAGTGSIAVATNSLPVRESAAFAGAIAPIEGDVNPTNVAGWVADVGNFAGQLTLNAGGTFTASFDTSAYDRWTHVGDLNGATGWTIEARLRIDSTGTVSSPPGVFDIQSRSSGANARAPWMFIRPDGMGKRAGPLDVKDAL